MFKRARKLLESWHQLAYRPILRRYSAMNLANGRKESFAAREKSTRGGT